MQLATEDVPAMMGGVDRFNRINAQTPLPPPAIPRVAPVGRWRVQCLCRIRSSVAGGKGPEEGVGQQDRVQLVVPGSARAGGAGARAGGVGC